MPSTIAILIFDGVEEMDFVGPLEVFAAAAEGRPEWRVVTVAQSPDAIRCEKGLKVLPGCTFEDVPRAEVVVIPGGSGARRMVANEAVVSWLQSATAQSQWIASVCTGAFLLAGVGLAKGRRVTTHHDFLARLREVADGEVVEGVRLVRDGRIVSAGGVMSGIEMSLWLVGRLWGEDAVASAKSYIAYDFPPRSSVAGDL